MFAASYIFDESLYSFFSIAKFFMAIRFWSWNKIDINFTSVPGRSTIIDCTDRALLSNKIPALIDFGIQLHDLTQSDWMTRWHVSRRNSWLNIAYHYNARTLNICIHTGVNINVYVFTSIGPSYFYNKSIIPEKRKFVLKGFLEDIFHYRHNTVVSRWHRVTFREVWKSFDTTGVLHRVFQSF